MQNKDEQQISGVSNSTINQAKGNIINNSNFRNTII